jgi:hypothetical protein
VENAALVLVAALASVPTQTTPQVPLVLSLSVTGTPDHTQARGRLLLRSADDSDETRSAFFAAVPSKASTIEFSVAPGEWEVQIDAPGFWAPAGKVRAEAGAPPVRLELWPAAALAIPLPPSLDPAAKLVARLREAEISGPARIEGAILCERPTRAEARCQLPATRLDLKIESEGWVPRYLWALQFAPGEEKRVDLRMRSGPSVAGYLRDAGAAPRSASVEVQDAQGKPVRIGTGKTLGASADGRGFFQIEGLAPGDYRLIASGPGRRSGAAAVTLEAGRETRLSNFLELSDPVDLVLDVEPTTPPGGGQWLVVLTRLRDGLSVARARLTPGEALRLKNISRGQYALDVVSGEDTWASEIIQIDDEPGPVTLRLPITRVRGTVKLGSQPLKARLSFGARAGGASVVMDSDDQGGFQGHLPRAGSWSVQIDAVTPPVSRVLRAVAVDPGASGEATVDLTLPTTALSGTVTDTDGRPVRALVDLMPGASEDLLTQVWSDADGRYSIRGLPPGRIALSAQAEGQKSDTASVVLRTDDEANVPLVVSDLAAVPLAVRDTAGAPVAGARVITWRANAPWTRAATVWTDMDGHSSLRVPKEGVTDLNVLVGLPGSGVRMFRAQVAAGTKEVNWVLKGEGGSLVVEANGADREAPGKSALVVQHAGVAVFLPALRTVAGASPEAPAAPIRVPNLGVGDYAVCLTRWEDYIANKGASAATPTCSSGRLEAGGTLVLPEPEMPASSP